MESKLDLKRIIIFLVIAFGIAWASGLYIYLNGGLANSPQIRPGVTMAVLILATVYMSAPAVAHILTRLFTREGWKNLYLWPRLRHGWPYWLICWFAPGILVVLGMALFFLLFPQYFDPNLGNFRVVLERSAPGRPLPNNLWPAALVQFVSTILIAPILGALPTLGEEFGWRAYLLEKLMPLGTRTALIVTGLIWGVWHWPVIAMGYEYGFNYPGFPYVGMLLFPVFTVSVGTLIGWAVLRSGSVWPAVIGHGAVNGIAGITALFLKGQPNRLLGPGVVGIIGGLGFLIVGLIILLTPRALTGTGQPVPARTEPGTAGAI